MTSPNGYVAVVVKTVLGSHFGLGEFTSHFRTYFSGDWDVHWGYGVLTHGHVLFSRPTTNVLGGHKWVWLKRRSEPGFLFFFLFFFFVSFSTFTRAPFRARFFRVAPSFQQIS